MDNKITVDLENLTDTERETLIKLVKKGNESPKPFPQAGDTYYYVDSWGELQFTTYYTDLTYHSYRINMNNCFKTKKEAETYKEKLLTQAMWKRMAKESWGDENPWDSTCPKYELMLWNVTENLEIISFGSRRGESNHFRSKQALETAIKTIGEEKVKKYILGVE